MGRCGLAVSAMRGSTEPTPGRHLLVASTGGHLAQLMKWSELVGSDPDSLFVTFESPQSHSLLRDRRVMYVPYVAPRNLSRAASAFTRMMQGIDWRAEGFTAAISTGAAVGIAGLGAARMHRVPSFYFESVSRVNGPSLTGKIVSLDPWIQKYCQYEHWAGGSWTSRRSLFDAYVRRPKSPVDTPRIFVTLGTIQPYRFDAAVEGILGTGLTDGNTCWQVGATERDDLPGHVVSQMDSASFERTARSADVVVTHAGVGTIMNLLDMGIHPVVVPRRAHRNEHVDDHQTQIAKLVADRAISVVSEANALTADAIIAATASVIEPQRRSESKSSPVDVAKVYVA